MVRFGGLAQGGGVAWCHGGIGGRTDKSICSDRHAEVGFEEEDGGDCRSVCTRRYLCVSQGAGDGCGRGTRPRSPCRFVLVVVFHRWWVQLVFVRCKAFASYVE